MNKQNYLKKWRSKKAKEGNIPPYCIMHDKTLTELAKVMPGELSELKKIYGIGNAKINQYGEEILNIVKSNQKNIE